LWGFSEEFLGDGISDGEFLFAGGLDEFSVDEVLVDSGEGVSVESGEK
jgi:hypothetical protein